MGRQTPEGRVKDKCKKILKARGIWYYMPVQNGMGVVGIPDLICCMEGRFLGIETKAPGKLHTLTANQRNRIREIHEAGGFALVIDDPEHLEEWLNAYEKIQAQGEGQEQEPGE